MSEKKTTAPKTPSPKKISRNRARAVITLITLIIAIVAFIAAFMTIRRQSLDKKQLTAIEQTTKASLTSLKESQRDFQKEITEKFTKNEANLNQLLQQTTNISAEQAIGNASYLTQLAQLNLRYTGDINQVKAFLHLALKELNKFHTSKAEHLKQKISDDLNTLNKASFTNPYTVLSSLDTLIAKVKNISVIPTIQQPPNTDSTLTDNRGVWDKVKHNLAKIKSFIVIRKIENSESYAFTPEQRILAKQLALIKLTQAQWAVINRNQHIYTESLQSAKKMLSQLTLDQTTEKDINQLLDKLIHLSLNSATNIDLTSAETPLNASTLINEGNP